MSGERAAGGVAVRGGEVLLIMDAYGRWTFPKGHLEEGESWEEAAVREIREETGIETSVRLHLGDVAYALPNGTPKTVRMFLLAVEGGQLTPDPEEVKKAAFVTWDEALTSIRQGGYEGYDRWVTLARSLSQVEQTKEEGASPSHKPGRVDRI